MFKTVKVFGGGKSKMVPRQEIGFEVFVLICFFGKGLFAKVHLWGRVVLVLL